MADASKFGAAVPVETQGSKFGNATVAQQSADFESGVQKLEGGAPYRFASNLAAGLNPVSALAPLTQPIETAKAIRQNAVSMTRESLAAAKNGQYGRAALSAVEAVPLVGNLVSNVEDDVSKGNYAGALGTVGSLAAPELLRLGGNYHIPSSLNPVEADAVNWGRNAGVPLDLGTATGNRFVGAMQAGARKQPFLANRAAELTNQEMEGLTKAGEGLISSTGPVGEKMAAGQGVTQAATGTIDRLHQEANAAYEQLRDIAKKNVKIVQVGEKPSTILDPSGNPVMTPEYKSIAMPTEYGGAQAIVKPILARLEETIPEAQKQASPGIGVLRQIMARPPQVDINTAISDLSAIQNIARNPGELDAVRGVSKGLAATAIPPLRRAIDAAAADAGPDAVAALSKGRQATTAKYAAADVLKQLPDEPVQLVNRLARSDDQNIQLLRSVQKIAPGQLPSVGRSFLEGIMEGMTSEGDLRRTGGALNQWNKMGQQTKDILFPDKTTQANIGNFFKLAKMVTDRANPSESATTIGAVMAAFHPKVLAAELVAGRPIADMLFGPQGAEMARTGVPIRLPKAFNWAGRGVAGSNAFIPPPPPPPQ